MFWRYAPGILKPFLGGYCGTSVKNQQRANYPKNKNAQLSMMAAVPVFFGFIE
jgi:hypothetical protein